MPVEKKSCKGATGWVVVYGQVPSLYYGDIQRKSEKPHF